MRVEHEYERRGALAYLAAYDVHQAQVMGRTDDTTGIVAFGRLVEQVMTREPYASARRVFWIVDNGSSHRGQASIDRLEGEHPRAALVTRLRFYAGLTVEETAKAMKISERTVTREWVYARAWLREALGPVGE